MVAVNASCRTLCELRATEKRRRRAEPASANSPPFLSTDGNKTWFPLLAFAGREQEFMLHEFALGLESSTGLLAAMGFGTTERQEFTGST